MTEREFQYDLFITYSHADDQLEWIKSLVQQLIKYYARMSPDNLRVYLDETTIQTMDDWKASILVGLRSSKLMLAIVSPNYFASDYCRKEWENFVLHERDRGLHLTGIAPVYVTTVPGFETEAVNEWVRNIASRQCADFRTLWTQEIDCLDNPKAQARIEDLEHVVYERLTQFDVRSPYPTNIPSPPDTFVGRLEDLGEIRRDLAHHRIGAIVVLQGLGGIGKSVLTQQYARTFASEYPGGRFVIQASGVRDIEQLLLQLATLLEIDILIEDRQDPDFIVQAVQRVLSKGPKRLLVLDNIDVESVLAPAQLSRLLPRTDQLHVLATTRIESDRFSEVTIYHVKNFSEKDGISLLNRYREINHHEESDAREIVHMLGRHPFALEVVGVFLWRNPDVSLAAFGSRLRKEGIAAIESASHGDEIMLSRHEKSSINKLLEPTLSSLSALEMRAVEYISLFSPDFVPMPWIRILLGDDYPDVIGEVIPGYPDPWKRLVRRIQGLRLLNPGRSDQLTRMHRIVRGVVRNRLTSETLAELREKAYQYAISRSLVLNDRWAANEYRWEIEPLVHMARCCLEEGEHGQAIRLILNLQNPLWQLARYKESRALLQKCLQLDSDDETTIDLCAALARVERSLRNHTAALKMMTKAAAIADQSEELDSERHALCANNLGRLMLDHGKFDDAEEQLSKARELYQGDASANVFGHATCLFNLAQIKIKKKEIDEARAMLIKSKDLMESHHTFSSQAILVNWLETVRMLATLERDSDNLGRARQLLIQAMDRGAPALGDLHPVMAFIHLELASIMATVGNMNAAFSYGSRALQIAETVLPIWEHVNFIEVLAFIAKKVEKWQEARLLWRRLLDMLDRETPNRQLHQILANLAITEQMLENYDDANECIMRSIAMQENMLDMSDAMSTGLLVEAYLIKANIEGSKKNAAGYCDAMSKYLETAELGNMVSSDQPWPEQYAHYVNVLQSMGNWTTAYSALNRMIELMIAGGAPSHNIESARAQMARVKRQMSSE